MRITVTDYASALERIKQLEGAVQDATYQLTDFLMGAVPDDETWEDAFPETDFARTILLDVLP